MADKIDLLKLHSADYVKPKTPKLIDVGPAKYLVVDGNGPPGGKLFESRIGALYGMAYTVKFNSKFAGRDYTVGKLEGLYPTKATWRLMIRVPDFIDDERLGEARRTLEDKGKEGDFDAVVLETLDEGRCVQMLHVGPYEEEQRTIDAMQAFIDEKGLTRHMCHHEIYLSDPRRVPQERLKTIIRLPVTAPPSSR